MTLLLALLGGTSAQDIIGAGGIGSAEALGQPAISASVIGGSIASAEAFGAPVISASVIGGSIASAEALGAPVISATIAGGTVASAEALGQPAISASVIGGSIAGAEAFGGSVIAALIDGGSIASAEALGLPLVYDPNAPWNIVDAGGIASGEALGQPIVGIVEQTSAAGRRRRYPQPRYDTPLLYLIPPAQSVAGAGGIESAEAIGRPVISVLPVGRPRKHREEEWILRRAA